MKSFIAACIIAIVIAVGGAVVLEGFQEPASEAFSTTSTRV